MKIKTKATIFLIGLLLCVYILFGYSLEDTTYLDPDQTTFYYFEGKADETIQWSFHTYNNPFTVDLTCQHSYISQGKSIDNGTLTVLISGPVLFVFENSDSVGGYINLAIKLKGIISENDLTIILIVVLSSIGAVVVIATFIL